MRTLTTSAAHCSVMSGELITNQAGRDKQTLLVVCEGGVIGRYGHQASANCKVKQQREFIICCCTFTLSNRVLLNGSVVYLCRWRRGAFLIQRLSGIDGGTDGLWPLALLCSAAPKKNWRGRENVSTHITAGTLHRAASRFKFMTLV